LNLSGCISAKVRLPNTDVAPDDEAAVLAAIDGFFESMAARDTETFATLPKVVTELRLLWD